MLSELQKKYGYQALVWNEKEASGKKKGHFVIKSSLSHEGGTIIGSARKIFDF